MRNLLILGLVAGAAALGIAAMLDGVYDGKSVAALVMLGAAAALRITARS